MRARSFFLGGGKLQDEAAKVIEEVIENSLEEYQDHQKELLATKQDIAELRVEFSQSKFELIKWMFIFWVGQIGVLTGILFAFFK